MNSLAKAAKAQISGSNDFLNIRDPKGEELYYDWYSNFLQEYESKKADGATMYELLTPGSKSYMGDSISSFVRPRSEIMQDIFSLVDQDGDQDEAT